MRKFLKILGWLLFVITALLFLSVVVNILMGSYIPSYPTYYKYNVIALLIFAGVMFGGWKLAHLKPKVIEKSKVE